VRRIDNQFNVQVSFPKYASVSTNIRVFSSILVETAISYQGYNTLSSLPNKGYIEFVSYVQYPYYLRLNSPGSPIEFAPSGMTTEIIPLLDVLGTGIQTLSVQTYRVTIDPGSNCTIDGTYATAVNRFQVMCIPSAPNCPTPVDTITFSFTVQSENFCAQIASHVDVTPKIVSYKESTFTDISENFLISTSNPQRAYFKISATSNSVSIQSVSLTGVSISSPIIGRDVVLWTNNSTQIGSLLGIIVDKTVFSILITDYFNVPQDGLSNITVTATMSISYVGDLKKRTILQANYVPTATQKAFSIAYEFDSVPNQISATPSFNILHWWNVLLILGLFILLL